MNFIRNLNLTVSADAAGDDVTMLLVRGLWFCSIRDWSAWAIFRLSTLLMPGLPNELELMAGFSNELLQVLVVVAVVVQAASSSSSLLSVGVSIPLKLSRTEKIKTDVVLSSVS